MNPTAPNPANNSAKVAGSGTGAAAISKAIPVVENVNVVNPAASTNVYSCDSALFPVPELNEAPVTVTVPSVRVLNLSGEPQRNVNDVIGAAKLIVPVLKRPAAVLSTEKLVTEEPAGAKGAK
jgi:hypothetical protein